MTYSAICVGRANLGLLGGCAQVRGDDGVLELVDGRVGDRLVLPHVDAGAGKVSVLERIGKRIEVDQAAARDVEDDGAFGHLGQLLGADHASGLGGLGHVQGDEVGLLAHLVDVIEQRDAVMGGTLGRAVRVIADELHAKGGGTLGNKQADVTGAEDAERLVLELLARELGAIPLAFLHGRARCRGVTCGGEHERHGLLGSGHDVGERRVAHDDAALGGSLAVDVVDAHAGAADDLELGPGLDDLAGDRRGRAHDERIVLGNHLDELFGRGVGLERDFVTGILEHGNAGFVELLRNQYLHDHPHFPVAITSWRSKCSYCSDPSSRAIRVPRFGSISGTKSVYLHRFGGFIS